MANKAAGRDYLLLKSAVAIAGVRLVGMKFNATPIDITDADSDGVQELLAGASATMSLEINVSGIYTDNVLRAIAVNPATDRLITDLTLSHPGAGTPTDIVTGNFFMTSYEDSGAHDGPVEFLATFTSSGDWAAA